MAGLPQGVVTFLFTDVEGSTRLWEDAPDSMMDALRQHDEAIESTAIAHRGVPVRPRGEGDSRFVVFPVASDAVAAAAEMQRRLNEIDWATPEPLRVRVSLHTGDADLQLGDYYGSSVNRAARLRGIAHGGQTVMSRSTWELVQDTLADDVRVEDMGEHRLKDLTRPEHVYQLHIDGLDADFPPLASLDAVPNNLPVQLTDFIGRPEVDDIKRLIEETRLITIVAPGGAGKTRSAIQAAAELIGGFTDGVFFIDLAPLRSGSEIAQTTAEAIGIALVTDEPTLEQLLAHLAGKRQLLVFDNFEHVLDGADIVADILKAAAAVKTIVTSRLKLNVTGETVFNLPGLDIAWSSREEAFRAGGVHLFIDAAKRADASFSLRTEDLEGLRRILDLVDGMPLGILLAASWVDMLPVHQIAAEISTSLDFLETEARDVPDRHRSLRAVFDYSWSMLTEDEQRTYAALSIFRDGFTREAAEHVAGASLRGLANLVGKSLIVSDRETGRYAVHEQLRQYAEEELQRDAATSEQVAASHTEFYSEAAQAAGNALIVDIEDQAAAVEVLERDIDNLRAALRRTVAERDADRTWPFIVALIWVHETRGWITTGAELFADVRRTFEAGTGDGDQIVAAVAGALEAKFLTNLGHFEGAVPMARASVETLRKHGDPLSLVCALEALCEITSYTGDFDAVLTLSEEALRVADGAGLEAWSAGMRNYVAGAHLQVGNVEEAIPILLEGDEALLRLGEHFMRSWNLEMQAMIALMQGRVEDAIEIRRRQVDLAGEVGYKRVEALALQGLGNALAANGEFDEARSTSVRALRMFDQLGLVVDMGSAVLQLAQISAASGDRARAVEILVSVIADPVSANPLPFEPVEMRTMAGEALADLEAAMDPETIAAAQRRGAATSLDVLVKELLTDQTLSV